jgi:hypothetical protein
MSVNGVKKIPDDCEKATSGGAPSMDGVADPVVGVPPRRNPSRVGRPTPGDLEEVSLHVECVLSAPPLHFQPLWVRHTALLLLQACSDSESESESESKSDSDRDSDSGEKAIKPKQPPKVS